jgi:hypothetical protein
MGGKEEREEKEREGRRRLKRGEGWGGDLGRTDLGC